MIRMSEFEDLLEEELLEATRNGPEALKESMLYAVFPSGGRVRPKLAFGIAAALGQPPDRSLLGAAIAVELIHCASLVHDDMPCFDDAATRRGKPSVHKKFGQNIALLTGDALIVAAFGALAKFGSHRPERIVPLMSLLSEAVGAGQGIIAGQAFESDSSASVSEIHRLKTGALFEGMAAMAAVTAGEDPARWRGIGRKLGMAYQIADDIHDVVALNGEMGKPVSQDVKNRRPNAVHRQNLESAAASLHNLMASAIDDIPEGRGKPMLAGMLTAFATRLCPQSLLRPQNAMSVDLAVSASAEAGVA